MADINQTPEGSAPADSDTDVSLDVVEAVFSLAFEAGAPTEFQSFMGAIDQNSGDTTLKLVPASGEPWEGMIAGADIAAAIGAEPPTPGDKPPSDKAPEPPAA